MSGHAEEGQRLWEAFLAEMEAQAAALAALAAAPSPIRAAEVAGGCFDLRVAASLVGIEPAAVMAGYLERLLLDVGNERPFAPVESVVRDAAAVLSASLVSLRKPDLSGARIEDYDAVRAMIDRLAQLVSTPAPNATVEADAAARPPMSATASSPSDDDAVWVPQVDEDMVDPFLEEATERIDALSQKLLRLETTPGDAELVREIFRDLHTVKGSSGFVGLRRMNRLAHAAEELVGQVRDGKRVAGRGVIDALLLALDGLRALLAAAARASGPARMKGTRVDVNIDDALARLAEPELEKAKGEAKDEERKPAESSTVEARPQATSSHTLRVDFDKLDSLLNLVGELVLSKARLHTSAASLNALARELDAQLRKARHGKTPPASVLDDLDRFQRIYAELTGDLQDGAGELDHVAGDLRQQVMKLRMLPIGRVFTKYHRTVRELSLTLGKKARLEVVGAETELDKVLLEQLDDPLLHLVRNALDHGIEPPEARRAAGKPDEGVLTLSARHQGNQIVVTIVDDGAGIDPEKLWHKALEKQLATREELEAMDERQVLDLIFRPGFSTAARVTDVSGRGVGMDVVRETITRLSGSIDIASQPGAGTTFTLRLPLTLAIVQVLLVRIGGEELALPLDVVERSLAVPLSQIHRVLDREILLLPSGSDEEAEPVQLPVVWLADALEVERGMPDGDVPVVLVGVGGETWALAVDRLGDKREIVLKPLGELLEQVPCVAGATLLGDRVALILDVSQAVQRALSHRRSPTVAPAIVEARDRLRPRRPRVLLAEDSDVIREALKRALEAHGCEVLAARDGGEALELAERADGFDLVSTDVIMPVVDGYELTRRLRAHPRHKDVPIVMVTSRSEHIDRVRGFDAGVDEYLTKPLDSGELVRVVDRHLGRRA
jgi:two-component system chemotaxis sensor kinase CheA